LLRLNRGHRPLAPSCGDDRHAFRRNSKRASASFRSTTAAEFPATSSSSQPLR
jgi:hypothetical protein